MSASCFDCGALVGDDEAACPGICSMALWNKFPNTWLLWADPDAYVSAATWFGQLGGHSGNADFAIENPLFREAWERLTTAEKRSFVRLHTNALYGKFARPRFPSTYSVVADIETPPIGEVIYHDTDSMWTRR